MSTGERLSKLWYISITNYAMIKVISKISGYCQGKTLIRKKPRIHIQKYNIQFSVLTGTQKKRLEGNK